MSGSKGQKHMAYRKTRRGRKPIWLRLKGSKIRKEGK